MFLIHAPTAPRVIPFWSKELEEMQKIQSIRAPGKLKFHKEWVNRIPGGQLIITDNSSHGTINFMEPELVVSAIQQAIEKAKSR